MQTSTDEKFEILVTLIKDVKPGLADRPIALEDSVVEHLGLDSLDILQLSRKVRRNMQATFDLDSWDKGAEAHNRSVQSILENIEAAQN